MPLFRRGPGSPNDVPAKTTNGVRTWHGQRVSCQRVIIEFWEFGTSAGTFLWRDFSLFPQMTGKNTGIPPF